jgi:small-conductance mechanosensitive channel
MRFIVITYKSTDILSLKSTSWPCMVWPWNLGQRSNLKTFLNSLGMISYILSKLLFAQNPLVMVVKKLFSIEIVIFHICTLSSIIRKILVIGSCLKHTWGLRDYETAFCWVLAFMVLGKKIFKGKPIFKVLGLSLTLNLKWRWNFKIEFLNMCYNDHW